MYTQTHTRTHTLTHTGGLPEDEVIEVGSVAEGGRYDGLVGMFDPKGRRVSINIHTVWSLSVLCQCAVCVINTVMVTEMHQSGDP